MSALILFTSGQEAKFKPLETSFSYSGKVTFYSGGISRVEEYDISFVEFP